MKNDRWLWAILLLGAAVRLVGLGERSLSYDECQQFWASQGNALISNREITLDPPGFACLLHLHAAAGRGETWLRLRPARSGTWRSPPAYRSPPRPPPTQWPSRRPPSCTPFAPT